MAQIELRNPPPAARAWLTVATAFSALAFGWAALVLPWRTATPLGLLAWGLALLHSCAALTLATGRARASRALFLLGVASLTAAPVFVGALASTSVQMVQRFGALGWGLAVALAAIGWLSLLGTLPLGLYLVRVARRPTRHT
jgi:hypothetical protein